MTVKDEMKKGDVRVVEDIRPSQNYVKNPPPPGLIETRVTKEQVMTMQDPSNPDPNFRGWRMHTINGIVPVNLVSGEVMPAPDGTIGVALTVVEIKKTEAELVKEEENDKLASDIKEFEKKKKESNKTGKEEGK